jgi:hypothetical protein
VPPQEGSKGGERSGKHIGPCHARKYSVLVAPGGPRLECRNGELRRAEIPPAGRGNRVARCPDIKNVVLAARVLATG